jgi:hypothetical protein
MSTNGHSPYQGLEPESKSDESTTGEDTGSVFAASILGCRNQSELRNFPSPLWQRQSLPRWHRPTRRPNTESWNRGYPIPWEWRHCGSIRDVLLPASSSDRKTYQDTVCRGHYIYFDRFRSSSGMQQRKPLLTIARPELMTLHRFGCFS